MSVPVLGMSNYKNKKACRYMPQIVESSRDHNIKPEILISLIFVESSFLRKAVSHAGACGLTQVIPKWTGKPALNRKYTCNQLKVPKTSIKTGAKILAWWIKYHNNSLERALCGYNAGFRCGHITNPKINPNKYGMRYSKKVISKSRLIESKKNQLLNR